MKRMQFSLTMFVAGWQWYVELFQKDERQLQLLPALNAEAPPKFWEGTATIPMKLSVLRGFADQNPEIPNPQNDELVPLEQPDGSEWRPLLQWRDAGGFFKPTLGPPSNNSKMIRIVSSSFKATMERFILPPHRFYPVRVRHEFTGEERDYFMFHLLGDLWTEQEVAYWPAMKFSVLQKKPRRNVQTFAPGSVTSLENYYDIYRSFSGEYDFKDLDSHIPYLVYREPYDLVWGKGWMAMSVEMGQTLEAEFGDEVVVNWMHAPKPIITGFDPERDTLPDDLLSL
jgi:hypothetical protein